MKYLHFSTSKRLGNIMPLLRLAMMILYVLPAAGVKGQPYYNQRSEFLRANSVWTFGVNAGLDFNSGGPTAIASALNAVEGCASAASPVTGQLLFYSDGTNCWNANHQLMPNGSNLMGTVQTFTSTTQGACIVPVIDTPGKYYLFSLNVEGSTPSLCYAIVDMSLDNGLGDIVPGKKNILLNSQPLSESMIAIPGADCDIWLMVHAYADPGFLAYHITRNGLDTVPVASTTGIGIQGSSAYAIGASAVSPDCRMLAVASMDGNCLAVPPPGVWGTVLARFDPATGAVTDGINIMGDTIQCYGVCFSPDNSKLYVSGKGLSGSPANIYQFDVSVFDSALIAGSVTIVSSTPAELQEWSQYLKLYNDTIYISTYLDTFIDRINQPNVQGIACGYQANAITLFSGTTSVLGLSNDVVYPNPPDTVVGILRDTVICTHNHNAYSLTLTALPGYYGYEWDDGSTGSSRTITAAGRYWVLSKDSCHSRIDTFIVSNRNMDFSLGNDTLLCDHDASLTLKVNVPGATYLWSDGSSGNSFRAKGAGQYWVTVSDNGCTFTDTIGITTTNVSQHLGPDTVLCKESPVHFALHAHVPEGSYALWSTGDQQPSIIVEDTGNYWVTVSQPPCFGTDSIHISNTVCECFFITPSAFSPNGDGLNDELLPQIVPGCTINSFLFSVYNRYGQRVFVSTRSSEGWDGTFNGIPADTGVYFFELRFQGGRDNNSYYQKGDATLIR